MVKNQPASAGDVGLILGLVRSPGEGNGKPLQYFFFWLHWVFAAFAWVFSGYSKQRLLFVVVLGLLIAVVSLVKHRL